MRLRYGENFAGSTQALRYGETLTLGGAKVTFHPAGHVLGSAQIAVECKGLTHRRLRRLQGRRPIRPARRSSWCPATCSSPRRPSACRCSATAMPHGEIAKLLHSVALFPERAHLVGAYSLGKAQRVIALIREAGYDKPIYLHGAMEKITHYYAEPRHRSRRAARRCAAPTRPSSPAPSRSARRRRCRTCGRGAFPIRCRASPPAGCGCARARASAASNCRWSSPTTPTGTA